jgi:hypothetical protein
MEPTEKYWKKTEERLKRNSTVQENGCINWARGVFSNGYGCTGFMGKTHRAHRVSFMVHNRKIIDSSVMIRHSCIGNILCVNPSHLEEGSAQDNADDRARDGTVPKGSKSATSKITEITARAIMDSKNSGLTQKERAKKFNTTKSTVRHIDYGETWIHLRPEGFEKKVSKKRKREPTTEDYDNGFERMKRNKIDFEDEEGKHWLSTLDPNFKLYPKAEFCGTGTSCHRIMYQCYHKEQVPKGLVVRHLCRQKRCINPAHLGIGSQKDNMADRVVHGTVPLGENHPSAKIDEKTARAIKNSKGQGTQQQRADRFGVKIGIVSSIDCKQNWKHLL